MNEHEKVYLWGGPMDGTVHSAGLIAGRLPMWISLRAPNPQPAVVYDEDNPPASFSASVMVTYEKSAHRTDEMAIYRIVAPKQFT